MAETIGLHEIKHHNVYDDQQDASQAILTLRYVEIPNLSAQHSPTHDLDHQLIAFHFGDRYSAADYFQDIADRLRKPASHFLS